mmetsp:Transcript_15278/g.48462  ORF Transcript_15278/g.48462 Transcript_15278/m.48462 type:complete len:238 (+) Transcript_15278:14-727(+)
MKGAHLIADEKSRDMLTWVVASALAFAPPTPLRSPTASHMRTSPEASMLFRSDGGKVLGALLAGLVAFAPLDEAQAARSGGRVGGRAPVTRSAPSRSTPAPASHTNVYIAPAPVYGGGYGGGYGYGYGGGMFGGGGISTGAYLGLSLVDTLIREQQRQQFLQQQLRTQQELGKDQAMIQQLQAELAAQSAKVDGLKAQQLQAGGSVPAPQADLTAVNLLQQQLLQQQKEIELLKASK